MEDKRNILFDEMPFSYKLLKNKKAVLQGLRSLQCYGKGLQQV